MYLLFIHIGYYLTYVVDITWPSTLRWHITMRFYQCSCFCMCTEQFLKIDEKICLSQDNFSDKGDPPRWLLVWTILPHTFTDGFQRVDCCHVPSTNRASRRVVGCHVLCHRLFSDDVPIPRRRFHLAATFFLHFMKYSSRVLLKLVSSAHRRASPYFLMALIRFPWMQTL